MAAGTPKHRKKLVDLLTGSRNIVRTLEAHIQGKQLYLYEFDGLHLFFTGPPPTTKLYTDDVSGSGCASDPLKASWTVHGDATDQPKVGINVSFTHANPSVIQTYRWIDNGTEVGTVTIKVLLVAGASPRMELQADETG